MNATKDCPIPLPPRGAATRELYDWLCELTQTLNEVLGELSRREPRENPQELARIYAQMEKNRRAAARGAEKET